MRTAKSTHYPKVFIGTNKTLGIGTHYVEIGGVDDLIQSIQISWPDATSNATITLESSNFLVTTSAPGADDPTAREAETDAYRWAAETLVITGPAGAAAGSTMIHLVGDNQKAARRLRLKIVAAAVTSLFILGHGKQ